MGSWRLFQDPRFALQFKYPPIAADGETIEKVETAQDGMIRAHILAPKSREIYFEVTKYNSLPPAAEYQRHKEYLAKQFDPLAITELKETLFASLPASAYAFEWDQGERNVILVERSDVTYRLIYNPRFPVNLEILSTVMWLNQP